MFLSHPFDGDTKHELLGEGRMCNAFTDLIELILLSF